MTARLRCCLVPRNPSCDGCELASRAQSVCLWGQWRNAAGDEIPAPPFVEGGQRVMILGQNPGQQEDRQARIFVGAVWHELQGALALIKPRIEVFYITDPAKCYSGKGSLKASWLSACHDYLEEELREVKPTHILAMGNPAIQRILGRGKINDIAGKETWSERYKCWVLPVQNPNSILYEPNKQGAWRLDVARFGALLRNEIADKPPVEHYLIKSRSELEELATVMQDAANICIDFEATPIDWWRKDWVPWMVSIAGDQPTGIVVPLNHPESPLREDEWRGFFEDVREVMQSPDVEHGAHNWLYDGIVWRRISGYQPRLTWDSMVTAHLRNENELKGLKWQGRTYLGWPDWDINIMRQWNAMHAEAGRMAKKAGGAIGEADWLALYHKYLPLKEMAFYSACDAVAAVQVEENHDEWFAEESQDRLARYRDRLVIPNIRAIERMIWTGMHVNKDTLVRNWTENNHVVAELKAKLPVENPNSPQQLAKWIYEDLKVPVAKRTDTGQPSTEEAEIKRIALDHPQVRAILPYRRHERRGSNYYKRAADQVLNSFDGRHHPELRAENTTSGRWSGPEHTMEHAVEVRSIYDAPPGWVLISIDSAQIEMRYVAWRAAGRPLDFNNLPPQANMLRAFLEGRDIYVETANTLLRRKKDAPITRGREGTDPIDPKTGRVSNERQDMGKVPALANAYEISVKGFREYAWKDFEVAWTMNQARQYQRDFFMLWPEIPEWHREATVMMQATGRTSTDLGRVRHVPAAMGEGYTAEAAIRSGINAPIQGVCSDIVQEALIELDAILDPSRSQIVFDHHDALLFLCQEKYAEELVPMAEYVFKTAPSRLRELGLDLPDGLLDCEVEIGAWGNSVSYKKWREQ